MLSKRSLWDAPVNRLTQARRVRAAQGLPLYDLAESNPTRAGFKYPEETLARALAAASHAGYSPEPFGLRSARVALAEYLGRGGREVDPDRLVLTASTSEAYSFLFRLLGDAGDRVLTATPAYPLIEHIASLDLLHVDFHHLAWHSAAAGLGRWHTDVTAIREAWREETRALVAVNPNNPTGNFLRGDEQQEIARFVSSRDAAVISDEVFLDYPLADTPRQSFAANHDVLSFALGGLSKSAALPHWKLGWIEVNGPAAAQRQALEGLELIADTFLSVGTPVQEALPEILSLAPSMQKQISSRLGRNLSVAHRLLATLDFVELLPVEGGWSLVLRLPRIRTDEELALQLLEREGVVVQPGYFFDFSSEGFIVLSLLTRLDVFEEGVAKLAEFLGENYS